jgi:hypothetical protein
MELTGNGTVNSNFSLASTASSVTVVAKADLCSSVGAAMIVSVDGTQLISTTVNATSLTGYTAATNLAAGSHSLSIAYTNDTSIAGSCDRNLYIDVTNFYGPIPAPTPVPTVALSASPTSVAAGQASTLTWTSTNATGCTASGAWSGTEPTSGSVSTGAINQTSTYSLTCTGSGGSATASTTVSVSTSSGALLFGDEFNGTSLDTNKWDVKVGNAPFGDPATASNVFLDGSSHLVVRTARNSTGGYTGGFLATFNYGSGWPPTGIKASLPVPFRIDMRALMPNTAGAHSSLWMMNVDRPTSQNIYELDTAEERTTLATTFGSHQHTWLNGSDTRPVDGQLTISSMRTNWHVYSADVYSDHVTTYCDGVRGATFYGVSGHFGAILSNGIAPAGTWGAAGGQPSSNDPGPWDMLVDYVHVSALH